MNVRTLRTLFGKYYHFCTSYHHLPKSVIPEHFRDDFFTRQFLGYFHATEIDWLPLTNRFHDYSGWRNTHPHLNIQDYISQCLMNKKLFAFEIKQGDKNVNAVARRGLKDSDGVRYQFAHASILLLMQPEEIKSFSHQTEVDAFLNNLKISQAQLQSLNHELDLTHAGSTLVESKALHKELSIALLDGRVIIAVDRSDKRYRLKTSDDYHDAEDAKEVLQTNQAFMLGPHDDGSNSFTVVDSQSAHKEPKSFEEAARRLDDSRVQIKENNGVPILHYNQEQLEAMVQANSVAEERFQVRLMEKRYLADYLTPDKRLSGKLGGPLKGTEGIKYWTTGYSQIEDIDSDPKLAHQKMGLDNYYDPKKKYVMVIIDQQKARNLSGSEVITPTFENMIKFIEEKVADNFNMDVFKETMTSEAQVQYKEMVQKANEQKLDLWEARDRDVFLNEISDPHQEALFQTRFQAHDTLGANELFLGTGMTKNDIPGLKETNPSGVVETYTYDRSPKTLSKLADNRAIKIIDLSEIGGRKI